jgi:uncharacterized protein Usg
MLSSGTRPSVNDLYRYRLTTAEILYRLPDYPKLLQSYLWQEMDVAPDFPRLTKFLDYWERNLDGRLHTVRIANAELVRPQEIAYAAHDVGYH